MLHSLFFEELKKKKKNREKQRKTKPSEQPLVPAFALPKRCFLALIGHFRYIEIQPKTTDLSTRLWAINPTNSVVIPEARTEVYYFRLNFNISRLVYFALVESE